MEACPLFDAGEGASEGHVGGRRAWARRGVSGGELRWRVVLEGRFGARARVRRAEGAMWLGDPAFDRHARVEGDEAAARGALSEPARLHVLRLFAAGAWEVAWGPAGLTLVGPRDWAEAHVELARGALLGLCAELEARADLDEALLAVALEDPEVRVRAAAAGVLLRRLGERPPERVARACAALLASSRVRPRLRLDALHALRTHAPDHEPGVLEGLLGLAGPGILAAVLERLGEIGDRAAQPELARRARDGRPEVAAAAVSALARLGAVELEPLVLERLFEGPPAVRRAAADALGELGQGAPAARALHRVAGDRASPGDLRRAARRAERRLAARLPPSGALSLSAPGSDGALAEAPAPHEAPDHRRMA